MAYRHLLRRSLLDDAPLPSRNCLPARAGHVLRWVYAEAGTIPQRKTDHRIETPETLEHLCKLHQIIYLPCHCRSYHLLLLVLVLGVCPPFHLVTP